MIEFTKLVPEIIQSSIWNESAEIRIVWITLLAVKDAEGYVQGDARTIARLANVSLDVATTALDLFQQPDPQSHTPDNEGRRIAPMNGGWLILNHELYRFRDNKAEHAAYVKEWRKKRKPVNVIECDSQVNSDSTSSSKSSSQEKRDPNRDEIRLARMLLNSILSWKPNFKEPSTANLESWASDIEKAIRLDHRSPAEMETIIKWLPAHSGSHGFMWRNNILSGATFRKQFDKLDIAMRPGSPTQPAVRKTPVRRLDIPTPEEREADRKRAQEQAK